MTKQSIVGVYVGLPVKKRIAFLMEHYREFDRYRSAYKECVVSIMIAANSSKKNTSDDLGVRVQTSGGNSDITYYQALERIAFDECFDRVNVTDEMFPDPYEYHLISTAVFEWDLMKKEFDELNSCIKFILEEHERELLLSYINKKTKLKDIANDRAIEVDSARKKMYRIRKKLLDGAAPWFNEYNIKIPA